MRINESDKALAKENISEALSMVDGYLNLSEIARAVEMTPPTVLKYVKELAKEKKVEIVDKKSMKLVRFKGGKKHARADS